MNHTKYLLCVFLLTSAICAQKNTYRDTLHIHTIRAHTDIHSGNAEGMRINLSFRLQYDEERHGSELPKLFGIRVAFFKPDGSVVLAIPGTTYHASNERIAVTGSDDYMEINQKNLFMPYYALRLPPGIHRLRLKVYCFLKDTSIFEEPRAIPIKGMSQLTVSIRKPETRSFMMVIRDLKVKPTNANGHAWDFGLLNTNDPELMYRISIKSNEHTDERYQSLPFDDVMSCGWKNFSEPIIISADDQITLSVFDKDVMYDDLIGEITYSLDQWKNLSVSQQAMSFGLVTLCLIETEELSK